MILCKITKLIFRILRKKQEKEFNLSVKKWWTNILALNYRKRKVQAKKDTKFMIILTRAITIKLSRQRPQGKKIKEVSMSSLRKVETKSHKKYLSILTGLTLL